MKKVKNKKRSKKVTLVKKHKCQLEYSASTSSSECSVWQCNNKECDIIIYEFEDAPAGA